MTKWIIVTILVCAPSAFAANILETAQQTNQFNTLLTAIQKSGLQNTLEGDGPFTVFAPTDEAFAKIPQETLQKVLDDKATLVNILTYHVIAEKLNSWEILDKRSLKTVNGQLLAPTYDGNNLQIQKANITTVDIKCDNGVIHVIDNVMMPVLENIAVIATNAKIFNTLVAAVEKAGLLEALTGEGTLTVFAPTDEAFAKIPQQQIEQLLQDKNADKLVALLKYHVLGESLYARDLLKAQNRATLLGQTLNFSYENGNTLVEKVVISKPNVVASNGIIHIVDQVLIPKDWSLETEGETLSQQKTNTFSPEKMQKIIELAIERGVPLYNHGQAAGCAAVYEVTINFILQEPGLPNDLATTLRQALNKADNQNSYRLKAWTYRYALDEAYMRVKNMN
ncbi:fasciclin domain-containing protein [Candidatus Uabimicrobium amorphum]|uniref:FAS1 domain-containing protein n=1 Tax=Uabimicrobium amorphum TaxID=2596890 RepID=A0A5S9II45_UABAM|nr:fasciclin domain-containing protein [Candidatus Uabimicrobium amorphum]BBM81821.1 hypothetical protein UABAM_00160 [Candidatus Uabimicrobium amorphum]